MGYPSDFEMNNPGADRVGDDPPMSLNEMARRAHQTSVKHEFYEMPNGDPVTKEQIFTRTYQHKSGPYLVGLLALIGTEVSEAIEAERKQDLDNLAEELADIILRVGDLAAFVHIDLDKVVREKMAANDARPVRHGGKLY